MAEVLPSMQGHLGHMDLSKMPQRWDLPDERDAYIGWLKGEFAAANAIIDSMCHHVRSIGDPGEYDVVFGCLNRRRQSWTPSLYMQQFVSVAEVVNSLQDVAWKKHQAHHSSSVANVSPKVCTSSQAQAEEGHNKVQLESDQRSSAHLKKAENGIAELRQLHAKWHQNPEGTSKLEELVKDKYLSTSKDVNGSSVRAAPETGEVDASHSLNHTPSGSAVTECNEEASSNGNEAISTTHVCNGGKTSICANHTRGQANGQASLLDSRGFDTRELLNMEVSIASKEDDARHTMIKRSMQFQCCERVDGQMINDGESVELCESVFSTKEVDDIIEIICQLQAAGRRGKLGSAFSSCKKSSCVPDIMQFGPKVSDGTMNDHQCLPKFLQAIIKWLTLCGILSAKRRPDSCIISIFDEGDYEPPNTDQGAWEKPLCVISLMEDCTMVFGHSLSTDQQGNCKGPFQVGLPAGSVLLLQENFAGILQKAIPASLSRRITIAMGKAINNTSIAVEGSCFNAVGKAKKKQWGSGAQNGHSSLSVTNEMSSNQARLASNNLGVMSLHHMIPQHPFPNIPSIQPVFPSYPAGGLSSPYMPHPAMLQGWSPGPKLHGSSTGTGVFFPTCDPNAVPTWQSGLLVLSSVAPPTALEVRRSVHAKRAEKHAGHLRVKGSFDSTDLKAPKQKMGKQFHAQMLMEQSVRV
eukprot:c20058_g1_i1 orf=398-2476(-)